MSTRGAANLRHVLASLILTLLSGVAFSQTPAVSITPATKTIELGKKVTFKARVTGPNAAGGVVWSVDGVVGGNATVGLINPKGIYSAPTESFHGRRVRISATSKGNGAVGSAEATLVFPAPVFSTLSPTKAEIGSQPLDIRGKYFTADAVVKINGQPVLTKYIERTTLTAYPVFQFSNPAKNQVVIEIPSSGKRSQPKFVTLNKPIMSGVKLSPSATSVKGAQTIQFVAESMPMTNMYRWAVNGIYGGYEAIGTIDMYGRYTAPDIPPTPTTVTISATTMSSPPRAATASVTVTPAAPSIAAVFPLAVRPGDFTVRVRGNGFLPGATALYNGQPTTTTWLDSRSLLVKGKAVFGPVRLASIQISNPAPSNELSNTRQITILTDPSFSYKATYQDAGRLLEQATFGPTFASIDRVRELGSSAWVDDQFGVAESTYPNVPDDRMRARDWTEMMYARCMLACPDQLRQRMVFALQQLLVVSSNKVRNQQALMEWQRLLSRNAFGNYRELLEQATLSPVMAHYLDMANSEKASSDGLRVPNENYAREIMQLFSIGLVELNNDGTPKRDGAGKEIPTYTQDTIKELARVFTGWAYPVAPGGSFQWPSEQYYLGQLQPYEPMHDTGSKTLLRGFVIPAGGSARSDLEAALDNIFNHPNVGPFVALRLIRHFVKSNPSPAYVNRVASAFNNNGLGVRGDLTATLKAVLKDTEARDAALTANGGKLKEPIIYFTSIARALDGQLQPYASFKPVITREVGQPLIESPTVFNFFSPLHTVGEPPVSGPEFQIFSPITTTARANWVFHLLNDRFWEDIRINTEPFFTTTNDPNYLVGGLVNDTFFQKRMSTELKNEIIDTISRQSTDPGRRAMSAMWLAVTSGEYLVQH